MLKILDKNNWIAYTVAVFMLLAFVDFQSPGALDYTIMIIYSISFVLFIIYVITGIKNTKVKERVLQKK